MSLPSKLLLDLKEEYPVGARVELICMNDLQAPPAGMKGTVVAVDDLGTIHIKWDNGSTLGIVYGEDACRKIDK
jgi:hypothetical protein